MMRTYPFLFITIALWCAACDDRSDLVTQHDLIQHMPSSITPVDATATTHEDMLRSDCIEISNTLWLDGYGSIAPVTQMPLPAMSQYRDRTTTYLINASGDAMSELFARGHSELTLTYHPGTHRLDGTMRTVFFQGEVLDIEIDAIAEMEAEGTMMHLKVSIGEASMRTTKAFYSLAAGEISFALPSSPEGQLDMEVSARITLCVEEAN